VRIGFGRLMLRALTRPPHGGLEREGSEYGGWLIPRGVLSKDSIVYSGGVGEDASFDLALIERYGCTVWAFDPTPRAATYARAIDNPHFVFIPVGLWSHDSVQQFHAPLHADYVSHSIGNRHRTAPSFTAQCRSFSSLMSELGHTRIDLLKLDVEGAEYRLLPAIFAARPSVVCVELHAMRAAGRAHAVLAFLRQGYSLAGAEGWDLTFVRRSRD
jgi:FkbM family methyltransferase